MMVLRHRSVSPATHGARQGPRARSGGGDPASGVGRSDRVRLPRVVRRAAALVVMGIGAAIGTQAAAQGYGVRTQGAWTVAPSSDAPGCFMTRDYGGEGGTTLLFGLDADGRNHLSVLNDNWSIRPRDRLTLDFRLSNRRYRDQAAIGMASDGKRGFVTQFPAKFTTDFARSAFLYIDRGDVPVARLPLDGSAPALAELKRCIAAVSAEPAVDSSRASGAAAVPKDPFSPDQNRSSRKRR